MKKNILLVHTGGTISMQLNTETGGVDFKCCKSAGNGNR